MLTVDLERLSILLLELTMYASSCSVNSGGCGVRVRLVSWGFLAIGRFHIFLSLTMSKVINLIAIKWTPC
jgi:hypothetical protein